MNEINLDGPLRGIPVSVKECFPIKNTCSYIGCSVNVGKAPYEEDCAPIKLIKYLGGIPFVRTLVPQTMMSVLSSNPIDGTCQNPLRKNKSPGGSSSGEASLIASGGSILGFGTDIGGSIRIPSSFCGIVGFKPTYGRLTTKGWGNTVKPLVCTSWGPMARDVSTIKYVLREMYNCRYQQILDPTIPFLPFDESIDHKEQFVFGIFYNDSCNATMPGITRALNEVRKKCEKAGYKVVEFQLPFSGNIWHKAYLKAVMADGGQRMLPKMRNDCLEKPIQLWVRHLEKGFIARELEKMKYRLLERYDLVDKLEAQKGFNSIKDYEDHATYIAKLRHQFVDAFCSAKIDALICPVTGLSAPVPLKPKNSFTYLSTYSNLFNLLNFPCGSMPSGEMVSLDDLNQLTSQEPIPLMKDYYRKNLLELQRDTAGLPIGIQVVSLPWQDEKAIRGMEIIEGLLTIQPNGDQTQ